MNRNNNNNNEWMNWFLPCVVRIKNKNTQISRLTSRSSKLSSGRAPWHNRIRVRCRASCRWRRRRRRRRRWWRRFQHSNVRCQPFRNRNLFFPPRFNQIFVVVVTVSSHSPFRLHMAGRKSLLHQNFLDFYFFYLFKENSLHLTDLTEIISSRLRRTVVKPLPLCTPGSNGK